MKKKLLVLIVILATMQASFARPSSIETSSNSNSIYSTRNLAWGTIALMGATALTGRELKVTPIHISLASLSMMSYGFFMNSYLNDSKMGKKKGYKYASYSKWLHIPAMILLPVAGAIAQRQFSKGKTKAEGFGVIHKPAALAALVGMGLTTLSLSFQF